MLFPSGFEATFRKLTGAEISRFANSNDTSSSDSIARMLSSTWLATTEPGPYTWAGSPEFEKALSGDLMYGLIAMAVENVPNGRAYEFDVQCERRHERRQYKVKIDLLDRLIAPPADLDGEVIRVRRLCKETIEHLRTTGNRFETTCAGKKITYKLQSASDAKAAEHLRKMCGVDKPFPAISRFSPPEQLAVQCVEVDGKTSIKDRYEFFLGVDNVMLYALLEEVQSKDCGIETATKASCPECGWVQEEEVPFARIFSPRRH